MLSFCEVCETVLPISYNNSSVLIFFNFLNSEYSVASMRSLNVHTSSFILRDIHKGNIS